MIVAIPIVHERWLICGGRHFNDKEMFESAMCDLTERFGIPCQVITGGASGADSMAEHWSAGKAIPTSIVRADWDKHGKKAGPLRNQKMLDQYKPHKVIAFPGGRGTADMVRRARKTKADVVEIKPA